MVPNAPVGKAVILHHGLFGSSADWLIAEDGPYLSEVLAKNDTNRPISNNLGYELALRGYDVWLPNSRGNRYSSSKHRYMDVKSTEFWRFSMDEKISYDLPATINYIRKTTNSTTVGYVGHSQGTMIMFGLMSRVPLANEIIKPFIALAPVSNLGNLKSPIRALANAVAMRVLERRGGPFSITSWFTSLMAARCPQRYSATLCQNALFLGVGFNERQLNTERVPVFFKHTPAGTSWRNLIHFGQNVRSGKFTNFDEGIIGNRRKYGGPPPEYDMSKITNRFTHLIWSDNDWLTVPQDVEGLRNRLRVRVSNIRVRDPNWNHLDFIWGLEAGKYVYEDVIKILDAQTA